MARLLWTLKQDVGPRPRAAHACAFDTRRNRTVLLGGASLQGELFGDTWEWDGESWTQVNNLGPSPRLDVAMAFDAGRERTVLFGGIDVEPAALGDTWEWDGNDWTQMAEDGPPPRSGHAMVFDSARARIVLFGGAAGATTFGDTWEWDGDEWVQVAEGGPSPRSFHAMAFDDVRRRIVLFGGLSGTSVFGDTWEFDSEAWTQIADFGPPPSFGATLHFNGRRSRLFGGASGVTGGVAIFARTWEWNGRHWTIRQDLGPGPRRGHSMVFDAARQRGVLFGGTASLPDAQSQVASGETWEQFDQGAAEEPQEPEPRNDVSGVARDGFTRAPVAGVTLNVIGQPALSTVSDSDGKYAFARVAGAQSFVVVASLVNHLDTRNDLGPVGSSAVVADVFVVTAVDLASQATAVGISLTPGLGAIFVDLRDEAGQPREGLPAANITLDTPVSIPISFEGPFFFGAGGVLDSSLTVSTAFGDQSRAAFLNVTIAPYELSVITTDIPPQTLKVSLTVADGVTLTRR